MLTDKQIQNAKGRATQYRIHDTQGLSMYINPGETKVFYYRFKWKVGVKPRWKTKTIGLYVCKPAQYFALNIFLTEKSTRSSVNVFNSIAFLIRFTVAGKSLGIKSKSFPACIAAKFISADVA